MLSIVRLTTEKVKIMGMSTRMTMRLGKPIVVLMLVRFVMLKSVSSVAVGMRVDGGDAADHADVFVEQ